MNHLLWNLYAGIKNGYSAKKIKIKQPKNNLCAEILNIFYKEGFIKSYQIDPLNPKKFEIFLKYNMGQPIITNLTPMSIPSKKIYIKVSGLWKLHNGLSVFILSTTRGFLTDKQCKQMNLGGKVFCKVK